MDEAGDDPAYVGRTLGAIARARNLSQLARDVGMSRQGLDKALSADGNPSFATIAKIARAPCPTASTTTESSCRQPSPSRIIC